MHESCVEPERDVVQEEPAVRTPDVDAAFGSAEGIERRQRVITFHPEVACEVVARSERDADKCGVTLDRHLRHRCERTVPARDPEYLCRGVPGDLGGVVAGPQQVRLDAEALRLRRQLPGVGPAAAGVRIHDEQAVQGREVWDSRTGE